MNLFGFFYFKGIGGQIVVLVLVLIFVLYFVVIIVFLIGWLDCLDLLLDGVYQFIDVVLLLGVVEVGDWLCLFGDFVCVFLVFYIEMFVFGIVGVVEVDNQ